MINKKVLIYFLQITFIAFAYYLSGQISFTVSPEHSIVTIVIFASEGFALASALLWGAKIYPGIFIGQFLLAFNTVPIEVALSLSLINSIEAIIGVSVFNYFKLNKNLNTSRDIIGLLLIIVFLLQPFSSLLGNSILVYFSIISIENIQLSLFSWWFGNIMGQILFVPTLLFIYTRFKKDKWLDYTLLAIFFTAISYLFQVIIPIENISLLLSITFPLIIYISSKKGLDYATFSLVTLSSVTLYLTKNNLGLFTTDTEINNLINLNFYFLSQMLLLLTIGSLFEEKKQREKNLEAMIQQEVEKNQEQSLIMLQQSRLAQMGQVINMITHQWRQPLNSLLLINEVLTYKYQKGELNKEIMNEFQDESALLIQEMSGIITDFRDFFQPRKNNTYFLLNDIVEHLASIVGSLFKQSRIQLEINEPENIYIYGKSNELAQAILNILYNAKDALITNNIKNKKISIIFQQNKRNVSILIRDNAGGIPLNIIKKIFDPYFSTKNEKNGTGLGLYMCKLIIEKNMRGSLKVENKEEGAEFSIELK